MFGCLVKKGAKVIILEVSSVGIPRTTEIEMPGETVYVDEDVTIDPLGSFPWATGPKQDHVIGGMYAKRGFYGFNYEHEGKKVTLLVHANNEDVVIC